MIDKVKKTIEKHNLIKNGEHIIIGVSGGPDSVCLLHILNTIKTQYNLKLTSVHINHMLRGKASDEDESYVKQLCEVLQIPCYTFKVNIKEISKELGISIEEAGRKARYDTFNKVLEEIKADKIAVAQNMNDQAETLLMRLTRGSGLDGLSGIAYIREGTIIRPLLDVARDKIETYCELNELNPKTDETNLEAIYTRNKIRLELIPYIEKNFNKNINYHLWKTTNILREDKDFIYSYANDLFESCAYIEKNTIKIDKRIFQTEHPAIKKRLILKAAHHLNIQKNIGTTHLDDTLNLIQQNITSTGIDLPYSLRIEIGYEHILFTVGKSKNTLELDYDIQIGKAIYVSELNLHIQTKQMKRNQDFIMQAEEHIKYFDLDKIQRGIKLRTRKAGDQFSPLGMKGTKKIKDFFIDEKIAKNIRDTIPLICSGKDVMWIIGYRISEKYKIDNNTKNILSIKISR